MIDKLNRNLRLIPLFILSQRRLFYAVIGIYFLTLPGASENVQMLGWFISAGSLASFIFEVPSGYISDLFGHKKTLVFSKILMIASTLLYIFASHWIFFLLGSIFISLGLAFQSGTISVIIYNTLDALKRKDEYTRISSKISANVSIISAVLVIIAPILMSISTLIPFYVALLLDFVGMIAIILILDPKNVLKSDKRERLKKKMGVAKIYKELKNLGFLPFSLFLGIMGGIGMTVVPFREVYLQDLGMPIFFLGILAGFSRVVWFFVGHNAHKIEERFSVRQIFLFRIFFTSVILIVSGVLSNPYIIFLLLAVHIGFNNGIKSIFTSYFLKNFISDERYKATALSIKSQISSFFEIVFPFIIGYVMAISYTLGFVVLGISALILLSITWIFLRKTVK